MATLDSLISISLPWRGCCEQQSSGCAEMGTEAALAEHWSVWVIPHPAGVRHRSGSCSEPRSSSAQWHGAHHRPRVSRPVEGRRVWFLQVRPVKCWKGPGWRGCLLGWGENPSAGQGRLPAVPANPLSWGREGGCVLVLSFACSESLDQEVFVSLRSDLESFSGKAPSDCLCFPLRINGSPQEMIGSY